MDLTALGKHAHTITIAWVIGRRAETEDRDLWHIDWDYFIRASLYELLHVSFLTDIKSPVLDEIRSDSEKWQRVNAAVLDGLKKAMPELPEWFFVDMAAYYADNHGSPERWNAYWILRAASSLATAWEFRLVEHANPFLHDLSQTKASVEEGVSRYQYIPAVVDIHNHRNGLGTFTDLCGRLRFQLRWSQTPILPARPVLDHELVVAYLTYACIAGAGPADVDSEDMWKRYQAFFGAMFHDLPEVLTRDVISPVKAIDHGTIGDIVREIEREWFAKIFDPLLPKRLYYELRFFALEEFASKSWPLEEWPQYLQHIDANREGTEHLGPVIEACDEFAAFMEAYYSWSFGVRSDNLHAALYPSAASKARRDDMNANAYDFSVLYELFTAKLSQARSPGVV